ncbi:MAG TPA: polysaccharide biosynthesis protein, partial [Candidatus Limnocylindrales bacterium]|nr:polysaccharide biosynthesis protein [Candidatus Limnocylindrales bacterium]
MVGIAAASYAALVLRLDRVTAPLFIGVFPVVVALLIVTRTIVNTRLGLYTRSWRYASIPDLERIAGAVGLGSLLAIVVFYGVATIAGSTAGAELPRAFWPIEALLSLAILGGVRFGIRIAYQYAHAVQGVARANPHATLLYGAGQAGVTVARSAMRDPGAGVKPVGFLDDDPALAGGFVCGLRVFGGLAAMERAVAETSARTLLISMPTASGAAVRRVVEAALELHLEVRTVPTLTDVLDGSVDAYRIRRVRVEDLLRRPMVTEHAAAVEEIIRDRVVMITGAGGSIGSELARQVFAIGPRRLVLVDRAESPLYLVQRELESRR